MNFKKIAIAAWGPIKTITIIWIFLIMLLSFINFIFFDDAGLLAFLKSNPFVFGMLNVFISGLLFLFWLVVWNTLIHAFFKEDLRYLERNGLKREEANEH